MEKNNNINKESERFKTAIINELNNAKLPISLIYYIFKDIMTQVQSEYYRILNQQLKTDGQEEIKQQEEK